MGQVHVRITTTWNQKLRILATLTAALSLVSVSHQKPQRQKDWYHAHYSIHGHMIQKLPIFLHKTTQMPILQIKREKRSQYVEWYHTDNLSNTDKIEALSALIFQWRRQLLSRRLSIYWNKVLPYFSKGSWCRLFLADAFSILPFCVGLFSFATSVSYIFVIK